MSRFSRWYARRYVCPEWGHKPDEQAWWRADPDTGSVEVLGQTGRRCANCGEEIRDDET